MLPRIPRGNVLRECAQTTTRPGDVTNTLPRGKPPYVRVRRIGCNRDAARRRATPFVRVSYNCASDPNTVNKLTAGSHPARCSSPHTVIPLQWIPRAAGLPTPRPSRESR